MFICQEDFRLLQFQNVALRNWSTEKYRQRFQQDPIFYGALGVGFNYIKLQIVLICSRELRQTSPIIFFDSSLYNCSRSNSVKAFIVQLITYKVQRSSPSLTHCLQYVVKFLCQCAKNFSKNGLFSTTPF